MIRIANEKPGLNRETHPQISLCMMVKDEEELLAQCLESVKDHVDEIVVVDTGSTDRTVAIAESFGARVFHHPWENDFSLHRNQSISYARGRWILIIDADEVCTVPAHRTMKDEIALAEKNGVDSLVMRVENMISGGKEIVCSDSIRLFRNNGSIRYEGIVHNNLTGFTSSGACVSYITHYGYDRGQGNAGNKFKRTACLLKKQITDNYDNAAAHMYLSSSYASLDMYEESLTEGSITVDLVESQDLTNSIYVRAYYDAVRALIVLKRYDEAEAYCLRATERFGDHVDIMAAMTMICFEKKQWERVFQFGEKYLLELDHYMNFLGMREISYVSTYGDAWKIYGWMGTARLHLDDPEGAERLYTRALKLTSDKASLCRHAGISMISSGHVDRSRFYLEEAYRAPGAKRDSRLVEALFKLGIIKDDKDLSSRAIEAALDMPDLSSEWLLDLATFAKYHKAVESALRLFSKVSEMDGKDVSSRLNISIQLLAQSRIEELVGVCDQLLEILGFPRNIVLTSLSDLSKLFDDIEIYLRKQLRLEEAILAHAVSAGLSQSNQ